MSFILDALRRAERERTLGQAPRMEDITHGASPPPRRPPRWVWVAAGAAISTVVLVALLWPRGTRDERTSVMVSVEQSPPQPVPAPAPAVTSPPAPAPAEAPAVATLDDLTPPTPEGDMALVDPELQPFDAAEPSGKPPPPPDDDAVTAEMVAEPTPDATPSETVMLDPPPRGSPAPVTAAPAGPPGVPKLRDMPPSFRGDFPKLSVDVHAYDPDPKQRFVMINARRYREGERLSEGPHVVEIVPAGIVFDFRGQKVLYTLNR